MHVYDFHQHPLSTEEFEELYVCAFKRDFNARIWEWRFMNNPVEQKIYISYVKDGDKLVSCYAVSPLFLNVNGAQKKAALSMMTMTHPEYGGKGLFKQLAARVYTNLKADNYYGVFGFANTNSHYGFRKYLNWQDLNEVVTLQYSSQKKEPDWNLQHQSVDTQFLETYAMQSNADHIELTKTPLFLKWRFLDNPTNDYFQFTCSGGTKVIYKLYEDEDVDLVDVNVSNQSAFEDYKEIRDFLGQRYNLNLWCNLHKEDHLHLEKIGFIPGSFNSYFGFIPLNSDDHALIFKNWNISMMYSDLF